MRIQIHSKHKATIPGQTLRLDSHKSHKPAIPDLVDSKQFKGKTSHATTPTATPTRPGTCHNEV